MTAAQDEIVIIIQGGAMRVAYALGVLKVLQKSPVGKRATKVFCSSAGTIAALGFAGGDLDVYSEELFARLAGRRFINSRRLTKIVDVDYLVDVVDDLLELDDKVMFDETAITVSLVDEKTGLMRYHALDSTNCRELLRATMAIPVLYGRKVEFGGRTYVDGGLGDSIPVAEAIRQYPRTTCGVILTREVNRISDRASNMLERAVVRLDPRMSKSVRLLMLGRSLLDQQAAGWMQDGSFGQSRIVTTVPTGQDANVSRTCTDLATLRRLMASGVADGKAFCERLQEV